MPRLEPVLTLLCVASVTNKQTAQNLMNTPMWQNSTTVLCMQYVCMVPIMYEFASLWSTAVSPLVGTGPRPCFSW